MRDKIDLCVVEAVKGDRHLGWVAIALRYGERVAFMEIAHFSEREAAERQIHDVVTFVNEWEMVTGILRDLDAIASMFSRREAFRANWTKLSKRQSMTFAAVDFAINYSIESDFRPDLTPQERYELVPLPKNWQPDGRAVK